MCLFEFPNKSERYQVESEDVIRVIKMYLRFFLFFCSPDIPAQVPPLTPGTNKKMIEALDAVFASWEKERLRLNINKGQTLILDSSFHRKIT